MRQLVSQLRFYVWATATVLAGAAFGVEFLSSNSVLARYTVAALVVAYCAVWVGIALVPPKRQQHSQPAALSGGNRYAPAE